MVVSAGGNRSTEEDRIDKQRRRHFLQPKPGSTDCTGDDVERTIGAPWLWLQEVTSTLFIYAIFFGTAVATRRNDHLYLTAIAEALEGKARLVVEIFIRLVVLGVAISFIYFGYLNFLRGFSSFRNPVDDADRLALCSYSDLWRVGRAVYS